MNHSIGETFDQSAARAVLQWEFKPATKDTKPVAVMLEIGISFSVL